MASQLDVVLVRSLSTFVNEYEFMLRAIEGSLTSVGLRPNDHIFKFAIDVAARGEKLSNMSPVHAGKMDGAIFRKLSNKRHPSFQESNELQRRHLSRRKCKLPMLGLAAA